MENALLNNIRELGGDILASERFAHAGDVSHHGKDGTIARHSLQTAGYALRLTCWLAGHGVAISERDVVRASLLHDIGMTEESVWRSPSYVKARSHPVEGARIAREEFGANEVQEDAILRHMWPVFWVVPPSTPEGWVVSAADKCCSLGETKETVEKVGRRLLRLIGRGSRRHHIVRQFVFGIRTFRTRLGADADVSDALGC